MHEIHRFVPSSYPKIILSGGAKAGGPVRTLSVCGKGRSSLVERLNLADDFDTIFHAKAVQEIGLHGINIC